MRDFLKTLIITAILIPTFALSAPISWDFTGSILQPLQSAWNAQIRGAFFTATSTATSTLPNLTSTNLNLTGRLFGGGSPGTNGQLLQSTGSGIQWVSTSSLGITGGSGGGFSNWLFDGTRLTPSTTAGIRVSASSTIGNGNDGLTIFGNGTTTGAFNVGNTLSVATNTRRHLFTLDGGGASITNSDDLVRVVAPVGYSGGSGAYFRMTTSAGATVFSINSFGNFTASAGSVFSGTAGTAPANGTIVSNPSSGGNGIVIRTTSGTYTGDYLRVLDNSLNPVMTVVGTTSFTGLGSSSPSRRLTVEGDIFGSSNIRAASSSITHSTSTSLFTSLLGINSEYFSDLTGTGLQNSGGVLTLNTTGDWTGTLDGIDGASFLRSDADDTATGLLTLTGGYVATNGTTTNATSTRLYSSLFGLNSEYFSDLTGFGLTNANGVLGINTTGALDGECLTYVSTGPTIDWTSCGTGGGGGGSGGGWATSTDNYAEVGEQTTYTTFDAFIGGTSSSSAEFGFDPETAIFTISSTTAVASGSILSNSGGLLLGRSGETVEFNFNVADTLRLFSNTGVNNINFGALSLIATSATTTNLATSVFKIGADALSDITGSGLSITADTLNCNTATASVFGCLSSADWTIFNNKVSSTSIDSSSELGGLLSDETGVGGLAVFNSNPLLAGFRSNASSTIGGSSSSTGLTVSGNSTTTGDGIFLSRIGIGTITPATKLEVTQGDILIGNGQTFQARRATGGVPISVLGFANGTDNLQMRTGGSTGASRFSILNSGSFEIFSFLNDTRLGIGSTTPTRMLSVGGELSALSLISAGSSTLNFASSTAFTNAGNTYLSALTDGCLNVTGGLVGSTGSACGAGGGGGGSSNWVRNADLSAITPSTTVGILVNASSSISALTTLRSTTTDLVVNTSVRGAGLADCDNAVTSKLLWDTTTGQFSCGTDQSGGGGGSSKWTDGGIFTYLTDTADDVVFGATATSSSPFWFDVSDRKAIFGTGSGDASLTFRSTESWTMGYNSTRSAFEISSTSVFASLPALSIFSTTSVMNAGNQGAIVDNGTRIGIGRGTYDGLAQPIDHLSVAGRIRTSEWTNIECDILNANVQIQSDGSIPHCDGWGFYEDNVSTFTGVNGNGYVYAALGSGGIDDGAMMSPMVITSGSGWMSIGSNTPSLEVTARIGPIVSGTASTAVYYIGISNEGPLSTTMETEPTAGCYFVASTTQPNWRAICRTSAANVTNVDTGVSSTTAPLGSGVWRRFRLDTSPTLAQFWIKSGSSTMQEVARITTNIPANTSAMNVGPWFGRTFGTYAVNFQILDINLWYRKLTPDS